MNSEVFINGVSLGVRPYGYISFSYNLTPYLKWDEPNVLAVRVDNAEQPNSRWYSVCGIYRNVWLTKLNPVHVAQWGTYVTAEEVSKNSARLKIRTSLQYDINQRNNFRIEHNICTVGLLHGIFRLHLYIVLQTGTYLQPGTVRFGNYSSD